MHTMLRAALPGLLLCFSTAALADQPTVTNAWARATAAGQPNGAAYVTLTTTSPDTLVAASTPVADNAELHTTLDDNGVMKMRPVEAIALTPGTPVTLAPGGYHVMLFGLHQPLTPGATFPLTLNFKSAPATTVTVTVGSPGGMTAPAMHMDGMAGHGAMSH